jgi:hypothetical protein
MSRHVDRAKASEHESAQNLQPIKSSIIGRGLLEAVIKQLDHNTANTNCIYFAMYINDQ